MANLSQGTHSRIQSVAHLMIGDGKLDHPAPPLHAAAMISSSRSNALVTGAARRIGHALADDARAISIHCRNSRAEREALAGVIGGAGGSAHVVRADPCDDAPCRRMMATAAGPVPSDDG